MLQRVSRERPEVATIQVVVCKELKSFWLKKPSSV